MLKYFLIFFLILIQAHSFAQLQYEDSSLGEAIKKSKIEDKPVFLFIYFNGCSHCDAFKETFKTMTTGGAFYNENFINIGIEMNSPAGKELKSKWGIHVMATPLFTFWDGDSKLLRIEPSTDILNNEAAIVEMGEKALDPTKYWALEKKSYPQLNDIGEIAQLAYKARMVQDTLLNKAVLNRYVAVKGQNNLSVRDFMLIKQAVIDIDSPLFTYLLNNKPAFVQAHGQKDVYGTIENIVMFSLMSSQAQEYDEGKLGFMKMTLKSIGLPDQKVKARFLLFETNRFFSSDENDKAIALFEDYYKGVNSVHPNEAAFIKKHLKEKTGEDELPSGLKDLIDAKLQK